jgi:hypothetical protein
LASRCPCKTNMKGSNHIRAAPDVLWSLAKEILIAIVCKPIKYQVLLKVTI